MEGGGGVSRSFIDVLHSSDIHRDQMEGASGITRGIVDDLHSSVI